VVRTVLASGGAGCAVAFGWRGDWAGAALAGAGVVLAVAFWLYGELSATRAVMRGQPAAGRHRRRRGLREVLGAAIRAAAQVPLP